MTTVNEQKIFNILVDLQEQMRTGFHDARVELHTEIQRLDNKLTPRIEALEINLEKVRQTQLEDSKAITEVLMRHDHDIAKIARRRRRSLST